MLRRRKADVEAELPGRTVKTYFVPMSEEQKARYEDYRAGGAADRAGATPAACAKGIRPTAAAARLHAHDLRHAGDPRSELPRQPKAGGAGGHPGDLLEERTARSSCSPNGSGCCDGARTGRRDGCRGGLAHRLAAAAAPARRDRPVQAGPACRLFLSTDSGSVGLNLQVASAVVNIDLPWNPAKLEQRIARAWRKNQTRSVTVVNLVTENSIEHHILHLLGHKQALADGVLDGHGDLSALKMPSGRAAFIERMQAMMKETTAAPRIIAGRSGRRRAATPPRRARAADRGATGGDGQVGLFAVLDLDPDALAAETKRHEATGGRARGRADRPR